MHSQARGSGTLADIDYDDTEREAPALRSECIRAAGVAAAGTTDVDAMQATDQQAAGQGAEQIGQKDCADEQHVSAHPA
jgi:UDP-N-acetylglucosamine 2-epimerase